MKIISAKNPVRISEDKIDLDVEIEGIGPVPFTACENDVEDHCRELYARAVAGEFGDVQPYVMPEV